MVMAEPRLKLAVSTMAKKGRRALLTQGARRERLSEKTRWTRN